MNEASARFATLCSIQEEEEEETSESVRELRYSAGGSCRLSYFQARGLLLLISLAVTSQLPTCPVNDPDCAFQAASLWRQADRKLHPAAAGANAAKPNSFQLAHYSF